MFTQPSHNAPKPYDYNDAETLALLDAMEARWKRERRQKERMAAMRQRKKR